MSQSQETGAALPGSRASADERTVLPNSTIAALPLRPPAHRNAPVGTSELAADRIAGHAGTLRARIYEFILARETAGVTDDEGELALGIKCQTYTPRRGELRSLGLIVDSGRRRNTSSGRAAAVWVASRFADMLPSPNGGDA